MMSMNIVINSRKVETRLTQKINGGTNLCARVNTRIALPMYRNLQLTIPVFRGYAKRNMCIEANVMQNKAISYIRFPTADPDDGHPYIYYTEFGRPAIHGKVKPKMRYYRNTKDFGAGTFIKGNPNLIFRTDVGPAKPSYFITDTMKAFKPGARGIAAQEVAAWLMI